MIVGGFRRVKEKNTSSDHRPGINYRPGSTGLFHLPGWGNSDFGYGIAVDTGGNAYVTGYTYRSNFPIRNPYQGFQGYSDLFVSKLDTNQGGASILVYSTYLGGTGSDFGLGIALEAGGKVYITGYTYSSNFPTINQYQGDKGSWDAFVSKLSTNQPRTAICKYIEVTADENCEAYITAEDIDDGSNDPDNGDEIALALDHTGPFGIGTSSVVLTVTDQSGESDSCVATVTVKDNSVPVISVSEPVCVQVGNGKGNMANKLSITAQDNCWDSVDINILSVHVYNNGGNLVNGTGNLQVMDQEVYVYPNGNGWYVVINVEAVDASGNTVTTPFSKNLLKCKK